MKFKFEKTILKLEISTFEKLLCCLSFCENYQNLIIFTYRKLRVEKDGKFFFTLGLSFAQKKFVKIFDFPSK